MSLDPLSFLLGVASSMGVIVGLAWLERVLDRRAGPPHPIDGFIDPTRLTCSAAAADEEMRKVRRRT